MLMVNIDGRYSISADKLPAKRMLKELLTAACVVAEDISVMTGEDGYGILQKAAEKAASAYRDPDSDHS